MKKTVKTVEREKATLTNAILNLNKEEMKKDLAYWRVSQGRARGKQD